jgi:hemolysin activation/secretion protein
LALSVVVPFVLFGAGLCARALAQEIPSSVAPAQIEERFDVRPRAREEIAPEIERPELPAPVPLEERQLVLTGVVVEGSTVYDDAEFVPFYEDLLAQVIRISDIQAVAKKITDLYQQDGYVLSQAVVPEQDVAFGVVTIRVIEGYVGEIRIEGQVKGSESLLEAYGTKITQQRPAHVSTLERYALLTEDLPGVRVRPFLEPVDLGLAEYRLILVLAHEAIQAFAQADNRGSRFVGPVQLWAGATFNSVFGRYETSRLRFVTTPETEELLFFDLAHTEIVGTEGTAFSFTGSYSESGPGFTLEPLSIDSRSVRLELRATHPIIRSRRLDLYLTGRFTVRDSETDRLDSELVNDQLRVIRVGATLSLDDGLEGRNWLSTEISQGLDILGASDADSPALSRPGASPEFTMATLDFSRYQRIGESWGLLASATGQKSFGTVLASEEIGLGGERFGRAYDPAEITGKDGAAVRIEIQRDGRLGNGLINQYQLYGYYDFGAVWTEGADSRQSLSSAGLGVRLRLKHGLFAYLEVAQPLTRPVLARTGDRDDPRVFFVLRANFL